jgi:hypothetical protein
VAFVKWLRFQWDRALAVTAFVAGAVALLLGWVGISGLTNTAAQMPYIVSGAVFGLFCLGIGATFWLSADLRDEWRKLDEIHAAITDEEREISLTPEASSGSPEIGTVRSVARPARVVST